MSGYTDGAPIYLQIVARLTADMATGTLQPGDRLPSVREAAIEYRVNHNTMHRVMAELERSGYIRAERGIGYFVVDDPAVVAGLRQREAQRAAQTFLARMHELGLTTTDIHALIEQEGGSHDRA